MIIFQPTDQFRNIHQCFFCPVLFFKQLRNKISHKVTQLEKQHNDIASTEKCVCRYWAFFVLFCFAFLTLFFFFISVNMTCIDKIILAFVIVQVALVLAKPKRFNADGLYRSNDEDMEDFFHKRASKRHLYNC